MWIEGVRDKPDDAAGAGQVGALTRRAPRPAQVEPVSCWCWLWVLCHRIPPLRVIERDFIVIAKPFPLAIRVAVHVHQAAVARRAEDLDDGPDLVHERGKRPPPLPNDDPIPDGRFTFCWRWCTRTAR